MKEFVAPEMEVVTFDVESVMANSENLGEWG